VAKAGEELTIESTVQDFDREFDIERKDSSGNVTSQGDWGDF
jgi:hypothetical protein